jgi:hypothetical protein
MYQMAVYFVLPASIRRAESLKSRKQIIYKELFRSMGICTLASGGLWFVGPLIISRFGLDNYAINQYLVGTTLFSGIVKVLSTIGTTTIMTTGTNSDIRLMNAASWLILLTSLPLGIYGSRWGISGIIVAVTVSWMMYGAVGFILQINNIRRSLAESH